MRNVAVSLNADNQIEIRVGTESRAGESYYLGLQLDTDSHEFRPAVGVAQLLREWIRLLIALNDGQQLFLPFDFSDEYTRWLTLHREGCDVAIAFGWSTVEGWAISPGDFTQFAHGLPGFMPDEPLCVQTFYRPHVLSGLRQSLLVVAEESLTRRAERVNPPRDATAD